MPFKFLCCGSGAVEGDPSAIRPVTDNSGGKDLSASTSGSNRAGSKEFQTDSSPASHEAPTMVYPTHENSSTQTSKGCRTQTDEQIPAEDPPPYHNWQDAVPDTALFPPPPVHGYLYSNTGNASAEDAQRAHDFCDSNPLWKPVMPSDTVYHCVRSGDLRPVKPQEYNGSLRVTAKGRWYGNTGYQQGDCLLLTGLPVYFPTLDSPLVTERLKTIYFEVKLIHTNGGSATQTPGLSIGYAAQPYPTWRSPGWERGSVGVFSDDGCRFVNDSWGGREFTTAFNSGETVGLGMTFSLPDETPSDGTVSSRIAVEIFLTRNGSKAGSWDLHEPVDAESGSIEGLEGDYDLYGAVGLFGSVEFEVCFDPSGWLWNPAS